MRKVETKRLEERTNIMDVLKYPILILLLIAILRVLSFLMSYKLDFIFVILTGIVYIYIGWSSIKNYKLSFKNTLFVGLVAIIISFVFFIFVLTLSGKSLLDYAGINLAEKGIPEEAKGIVTITATATSMILSIIIGEILVLVGALIARKR